MLARLKIGLANHCCQRLNCTPTPDPGTISYNPRLQTHDPSEFRLTTTQDMPSPEEDSTLPQDFETALSELEALVVTMESGSLALEQSLAAYRRGVALTRICQQRLAQAEQQVKVLEAGVLRPFEGRDEQVTE